MGAEAAGGRVAIASGATFVLRSADAERRVVAEEFFVGLYETDAQQNELLTEIRRRLGQSRLFSVGIGSAPNSYFLRKAAEAGRIGEVAPRFHGAPTNRSQVTTIDQDCRDILSRVREDESDAAVIVAN